MALLEPDALDTLKTLLNSNWTTSNVSGARTPTFHINSEQPSNLSYFDGNGHMLIYPVSHIITPNDLGENFKEATVDRVSIDIRVKNDRPLLRSFYNEAKRIVGANTNCPTTDFNQLISLSFNDLSRPGFNRYVYDVQFRSYTVTK